jgi:hypothetical protein
MGRPASPPAAPAGSADAEERRDDARSLARRARLSGWVGERSLAAVDDLDVVLDVLAKHGRGRDAEAHLQMSRRIRRGSR